MVLWNMHEGDVNKLETRVQILKLFQGANFVLLIETLLFPGRCPNGSCEPILNIYVPRVFQWCKELLNPVSFDPCNRPFKIWESTETSSPKMGVALGVWGFIPSHFPTLPRPCGVTLGLPLGLQPCKPLCLSHKPKTRVTTLTLSCSSSMVS
jgi:hypothetical protein